MPDAAKVSSFRCGARARRAPRGLPSAAQAARVPFIESIAASAWCSSCSALDPSCG